MFKNQVQLRAICETGFFGTWARLETQGQQRIKVFRIAIDLDGV